MECTTTLLNYVTEYKQFAATPVYKTTIISYTNAE